MKTILVVLFFVCLSTTSCNTEPAQVGTTPQPQDDSTVRLLAHNLEEKFSVPMTQNKYAGYVERMGRCPDRFDYLYEAALAHCYAERQKDEKKKSIVLAKSKEYFQIWKRTSAKPESKRNDFYSRVSGLPAWMISRYQEILALDPDHPFQDDMELATQELKEYQKKHNKELKATR